MTVSTPTNLKSTSSANLILRFQHLVKSERKITGQILELIGEIDKRKLYIEKGHTSLFEYLTKDFGYSPGAAMRRIDGARLLMEVPEVAEKFENGSLTLSQATQVQRASRDLKKIKNTFISSHDKLELVLKIENSSQKQTEKTIAQVLELPLLPVQKETRHHNKSVTLTITFTEEQMEILEQVQNMISHSVPNTNWADALTYLAQKELTRRTRVNTSNWSDAVTAVTQSESVRRHAMSKWHLPKRPSVPIAIRKKLIHPQARCEHIGSNGQRCDSARFLQIDHIKSLSSGGAHSIENFQVLCGVHNRLKYTREVE